MLMAQGVGTTPPKLATAPSTCNVDDQYYNTTTHKGQVCTAPNTWTDVSATGGARDFVSVKDSLKCNGSDDDTAALNAQLLSIYNQGGGTLLFPHGRCLILGHVLFPNDGLSLPSQPSIRIVGDGGSFSTSNGATDPANLPNAGTILDLRYSGAGAALDTRGRGYLEISYLTIINGATSSPSTTPFIQTTNTILNVHDVAFYGSSAVTGQTSNQDAIVLGSTTTNFDGSATSSFQGYGTVIEKNEFHRIRRGVFLQTFANGIVIEKNTWWISCGAADTTTAAVDLSTPNASSLIGNVIRDNIFETTNYPWVIHLSSGAKQNTISSNGFYDPTANTLAWVRFDSGATNNIYTEGQGAQNSNLPTTPIDDQDGHNTFLLSHTSGLTINNPTTILNPHTSLTGLIINSTGGAPLLNLQIAGAQQFVMDGSGNVGLGGTNPSYPFHSHPTLASTRSAAVFTGTSLNDATAGGTYIGQTTTKYCVQIHPGSENPDHFQWGTSSDGSNCTNGATAVAITGAAQTLSNGVTVTFGAVTGHNADLDKWVISVTPGGINRFVIQGGQSQSPTNLSEWYSHGGSLLAFVGPSGGIQANAGFLGGSGTGTISVGYNAAAIDLGSAQQFRWSSTTASNGTKDLGLFRNAIGVMEINNGTNGTLRDIIDRNNTSTAYLTGTNCLVGGASGAATPFACGSAAAGRIAVQASAGATITVNTTAVTANSTIILNQTTDNSSIPSTPTCNTTLFSTFVQVSRVAGTSFSITTNNPATINCFTYFIVN